MTENAVTSDSAGADVRLEALPEEEAKEKTEDILEALRDVVDPELGINVVDLGLVYGVLPERDSRTGSLHATLDMTLTSAACPLTDVIEEQAAEALRDTVENFAINWVWMPPWGPENITEDGREQLRALGFSI
jgi:metal-sulfur cluster biosynthetic enzyme